MQITTLGTSHGSPTSSRFSSSTLIETGDRSYLVDAGAPVHALLVRAVKPMDALSAVFITHMHEDHVGGLPGLCKHFIKERHDPRSSLRVLLPDRSACAPLDAWCRAMCFGWPNAAVALDVASAGHVYADDCITVHAERTRHMAKVDGASSFAYAICAEGRRAVFAGDLVADFSDFPALALDQACDVCVCEATHYDVHAAAIVLQDAPIRRLIFNHVHDPWHGPDGERQLLDIMRDLPYPVHVAHDGDVWDLGRA
jgi:ribonuclease BN (tRNA processing enzyme)